MIILSTVLLLVNQIEKKRNIETIVDDSMLEVKLVSNYCIMPLVFEDANAAFNTLKELSHLPAVQLALLYSANDSLFAYYNLNNDPNLFVDVDFGEDYFVFDKNWLHVKQDVSYNGIHYGFLYLKIKTNIRQYQKERLIYSLLLFVTMVLFTFLLSNLFQKSISVPILKLTKLTQHISKNQDYSIRINKDSNDEVGKLYDEFNQMLSVTNLARKELKEYQNHLEELIDKRTQDLRLTNKELIKAKEEAEGANKAKSEFLSNVSHELRTPLNGILGYSQILITIGNLGKLEKEYVNIIRSSGEHLLSLISEILDYSKIEAHKLELSLSNFNLNEMIQDVLNIIRIRAEQKDLLLKYNAASDMPSYVKGDETKMRQVLLNLLSNAVKYTKSGSISLTVYYDKTREKNFIFEVKDTGVGIAKEQLDNIFEPFTQVNKDRGFIEGTGLGLAITKKMIHLMNGQLKVESVVNQGSIFGFSISLTEAADIELLNIGQYTITGYKGRKKRILLVDDNPVNLSMLVSALDPLGFELHTAVNGRIAIQQTKKVTPDLILMDLVMPVMNGFDAIKEIRKLPIAAKTRIIGTAASVVEHDKRTNFLRLCDGHLDKPIKLNELYDLLGSSLKIEWTQKEELSAKNNKKNKQNLKIVIPDTDTLNQVMEYNGIGDFTGIEQLLSDLVKADKKYLGFSLELEKYIKNYDSDGLSEYIQLL